MNYYFYKSGSGNCFLPYLSGYEYGKIPVPYQGKSLPGLYVGFDDIESPWALKRKPIHSRIDAGGDEKFLQLDSKVRDDDYIAHIFHQSNRTNIRLIAFDKRNLVIMKIPDESRSLVIWKRDDPEYKTFEFIFSSLPHIKARDEGYVKGGIAKAVKFLEVSIEHVFPRDSLYLSVDSLSVFQYLNRGTCRPIDRIGTTDKEGYEDLKALLGPIINAGETPYGAFMRLYLDRLRGDEDARFESILASCQSSAELVLATLNPILFETLAFYLCLDLGLVPEAANGKGLDVIDVRARSKPNRSMQTAVARLKTLGVELHTDLAKTMEENHSLSIKCKAYSGENAGGNDFLMFRRGKSKSRKTNELFSCDLINILGSESRFQNINQFIASQSQTMRHKL